MTTKTFLELKVFSIAIQVQLHPSILPADFDITPTGELVLNLPPAVPVGYQNGYEGDATQNADGSAIVSGSADIHNGKAATVVTAPSALLDSSSYNKTVSLKFQVEVENIQSYFQRILAFIKIPSNSTLCIISHHSLRGLLITCLSIATVLSVQIFCRWRKGEFLHYFVSIDKLKNGEWKDLMDSQDLF